MENLANKKNLYTPHFQKKKLVFVVGAVHVHVHESQQHPTVWSCFVWWNMLKSLQVDVQVNGKQIICEAITYIIYIYRAVYVFSNIQILLQP